MGLRTKIGAAIAGTAALVAVVIGMLVHHQTVEAQFDAAVQQIGDRLRTAVQDHAAGVDGGNSMIDPPDLPKPLDEAVRQGKWAVYLDRDADGPPMLWAASKQGDAVVALRRPYVKEVRALRDLDRVLWISGGIGVGLGAVAGFAVASWLGRRLTASADTAQRIADGDLTARLEPRGKDEVAKLTAAVNTMADALARRIQAEREVTANIAHELRTPVAGMVTSAGLLPPGRPAELVQDSAQRLRELVDDVIEVARLDVAGETAETEPLDFGELVRRAVRSVAGPADGVEVVVLAEAEVETDPRRFERIVANLVTNALRHGAAPVRVEAEGGVLRVYDSGPGFPEHILRSGPQRFSTGAQEAGLGLGLTIATGQAHVLGARLRFANPDGGGALAVLDLRPAVVEGSGEGQNKGLA
ncbi:ATP-binding protein [Streptomyces indicus]|uniref:histidine kinase n=1 Tax=Streptomyces indicus TaxID=417292 RepID=A0A1G9GZ08_9ACTN|nr:ATP-binding protein [Streptomyces indicus]SDL05928.1 Signal transduction histidine kinase [Streptomyces indicus]